MCGNRTKTFLPGRRRSQKRLPFEGKERIKMSYVDITSQGASVLWGTRAAERNAETRKRLEKEHNVKVGDKVKIITEEVSEEKDGRRKRKKIRKATVVDLYENFILLRIKTRTENSFCESFVWQEFEAMRK